MYGEPRMRINIEIDDELINEALEATGLKSETAVVELGLKTLIRLKGQEKFRRYRSQLLWEGDLDESRGSELGAVK